ncbi:MAG: PilZ domain-containing protein [Candidatus Omnitrophica bacterium]|nr:PilZ domain-containing protein [Candidatus Omnitrophota bacterium]
MAGSELRADARLKCNLKASLRLINLGQELAAHCIDASRGGIGIFTSSLLKVGERLEIWLHFDGQTEPLHRFGRVVWSRFNGLGFRAGIKFESVYEF